MLRISLGLDSAHRWQSGCEPYSTAAASILELSMSWPQIERSPPWKLETFYHMSLIVLNWSRKLCISRSSGRTQIVLTKCYLMSKQFKSTSNWNNTICKNTAQWKFTAHESQNLPFLPRILVYWFLDKSVEHWQVISIERKTIAIFAHEMPEMTRNSPQYGVITCSVRKIPHLNVSWSFADNSKFL
jgi:hypothetical protein